mmetsp:Transcript_25476/g.76811  ORF Transcript_25476/g.76811 Transcript_25476/m.76811 type:complete len:367 (+) Transcript_25476:40-1140(+)
MTAIWGLVVASGAAIGHMSLVVPISRNAVDRALPPWAGGKWYPYEPNCSHPGATRPGEPGWNPQVPSGCIPPGTDGWGCNCWNGTAPCDVAQSCFWFSQGCTIGCKACDGGGSNPNTRDRCKSGMNATNNLPAHRTFNRDVPAFSKEDVYRWNPWRAPGNAPVFDSCGMAGGGPQHQSGEAKYTSTSYAKQGDLGSKVLPPAPTGVTWTRGSNVTVKWSIRANHGGGYQYRLCPLGSTLDEECFQKTPVPFAMVNHTIEYEGGSMMIPTTFVSQGTWPPNSTWAMNPFPYSNSESPPVFPPPCDEPVDRTKSDTGLCSGRDPFNTLISDIVTVPANIAPGEWVLGFRWDCEKSAQIWLACADITIV